MGYVAPVLAARTRIWMGWAAAEEVIVLDAMPLTCSLWNGCKIKAQTEFICSIDCRFVLLFCVQNVK